MQSIRKSIVGILQRLRSNQQGNILLMMAAAVPAMIGSAGLGTDAVQWALWKRQLQQAADSSALAGALSIASGSSDWKVNAYSDLSKNNDIRPTASSFATPTVGVYAGNPRAAESRLQYARRLPFSGRFFGITPTLEATAVAAVLANGTNCILALSSEDVTGVDGTGGVVNMGCGAAANARSASAIETDGSFTASPLTAVGGIEGDGPSGTEKYPYSVPQEDPFATLPPVSVPASCNEQVKTTGGAGGTEATAIKLYAGCYRNFKLVGGRYYELQGGTYILDTDMDVQGGATLRTKPGATVTILLAQDRNLKFAGNAEIDLVAPTSGQYKGVIIYQSRDSSPTSGPNDNKITGASGSYFEGAIYMPQQHVVFTGNSGVNSNCMQIVADTVSFEGSVDIANTCPSGSGAQAFTGRVVRLVG